MSGTRQNAKQPVAPASTQGGPRGRSITLKDVARVAGMAPITVSRALHNPGLVRPETIERVKEAVRLTGYIPNMLAGSLTTKRSRLIAAIVPQLANAMFAETVQGLGDELAAHGYQLLLSLSGYAPEKEEDILSALLSRQPDGIVLTGITHSQDIRRLLLTTGIPVVETWDLTPTPIDMMVGFSHRRIGEAIGHYLIGKGFRRFALVWADDARAAVRRKGLEAVLAAHGITRVPAHILPIPATLAGGRLGLQQLLGTGDHPEVVVCSSDALAQGVLTEAACAGLSVPRDLAVMGFGDFDFAAHTVPAISSVHIDKRAIGVKAARLLIARIEGREVTEPIIDVGFELIERDSSGNPLP